MASTSTQNVNLREDEINNDLLIEEVEKRPALYDKNMKNYSNINYKIRAWEKICQIIFSNAWGNMLPKEKTEAGKLAQKRWRNLRASFVRELREQKSTKSGQAAKKKRKYKHFDQLLFLIPSLDTRETSGNATSVEDIHCEEDIRNADEDLPQRSEYPRKKNNNKISYEERLLGILDKKRVDDNRFIEAMRNNKSICDNCDREKHFALSLVPLLKAVPEENKLEVQIKIFQDIQKQTNNPPTSYLGSLKNFKIIPKYSVTLSRPNPQNQLPIETNTQPNLSSSAMYIPSTRTPNFQIKPKYSVSIPPPSPSPQNQLQITTNTQSNSSPSPIYVTSKSPQNFQIKPKYSVSLPTPSTNRVEVELNSFPLSVTSNQNPILSEDSSASNSIKSYVSQFAPDSNEDSEIYDICQECDISLDNH